MFGLDVTPSSRIEIAVDALGVITPGSFAYTIENRLIDKSHDFEVTSDQGWISITGGGAGTLPPGAQVRFTVLVDGVVLSALEPGVHVGRIKISDTSNPTLGFVERLVRATVEGPEVGGANRVTESLVALYEFEEGSGTVLRDTSGVGAPLDLQVKTQSTVKWQLGALALGGESEIVSPAAATKINEACMRSGEITIEAWVAPEAVDQCGPASIVTLSDGESLRNVTLRHGRTASQPSATYQVRTQTTTTAETGVPEMLTGTDGIPMGLHQVVYTRRADGFARIHVDGVVRASGAVGGSLSNWDGRCRLALGNEIGGSHPWSGRLHRVAIYDQALTAEEIEQNLTAGAGDFLDASGDKPGPSNTGPSNPGILVRSGSIVANADGQVIENVDVIGRITIAANNVTIRNFRIDAEWANYGINGLASQGNTGTVIEDGEILNTASAALYGSEFTARRLNIHESGKDGIKARGNVLVEDCWIHNLGMTEGAHADGNQTRVGTHIVFRHNNIDMPIPESLNGTPGYRSNAAFMINSSLGPTDHFIIEDNWLNGGNFTIMLSTDGGGATNLVVKNNRFGPDCRYGTARFLGAQYVAEGNVWDATGELLPWNNH